MSDIDEFTAQCRVAARGLRRLPSDLRRGIAGDVQEQVAAPLADRVGAAARGPWAAQLRAATKARKLADPTIVIGGSRKVVSGGANPRQLVYGTEFGGGKRRTAVPSRPGRRGYTRVTTRQFANNHAPFVFRTVGENFDWAIDRFAGIVLDRLEGAVDDGR